MKKFAGFIAAVTIASAPMAYAGGMSEPAMEKDVMAPEVVVEDSGSNSHDWVLGLILLTIVASVAGN